ncbi:MAG: serine/threonine-protein kinase, partial [Planctomycetota bacterium]|nr:serine/threonine-protein kinase [Planctomycetota bacterium]
MAGIGDEGRDEGGSAEGSRGEAPRIAGRFEVLGNLGEGPLGKVYHVRDHRTGGREVALKILRATTSSEPGVEDLVAEHVERLQTLAHENLTTLRDAGLTELGLFFLSSDYVKGENLRALMDRRGALVPEQAFAIARQALAGLEQGHRRGLCHGHLKPENVLLVDRTPSTAENPHGVGVRVLDFGFAEIAARLSLVTGMGAVVFLAPEQRDGAPADARSDVWALGAMLYEMLTGNRPGPDAPESLDEGVSMDEPTREIVA